MAVMAAVIDFALLIFVFGFMSLLTDRDLIEEPDVGTLVGPAMTVTACLLVFSLVYRRRPAGIGARALYATLGTMIGAPFVGSVVFAAGRAEVAIVPVFFGRYVLSPFVLSAAIIGAAVVFAAALLERRP
ncbi:MAG: hypothetical protein JWL94_635 [Microbacteriaceae bacterium]|nr:hypothetical protein [Microbacteriaceae bacterium]